MLASIPLLVRLTKINGLAPILRRMLVELSGYASYGSAGKYANLVIAILQHRLRVAEAIAYPHRYYIEPTNVCNLRCPYCLGAQGRPSRRTGFMRVELFRAIVDQISPYAFWIHLYNRGEPLLHPDISDMVAYAHSKRIGTVVSSNLNVLRESTVDELLGSGLDHLIVPIDGATQESYAKYRIGGSLDAVLSNMRDIKARKKALGSAKPYITAKVLVMKHNEGELKEIRSLAVAAGAENVVFSMAYTDASSKTALKTWSPSSPDLAWGNLRSAMSKQNVKSRACQELWHMGVAIVWSGAVFPCCYVDDEENAFGNLNANTFNDVWKGKCYRVARQAFRRDPDQEPLVVCQRCLGALKTT